MHRKILMIILAIWLTLSAVPTAYADSGFGTVRVKLSMGKPSNVSINIDGDYGVPGSGGIALKNQQYNVKLENGKLNLYSAGTKICGGDSSLMLAQRSETAEKNSISMNNNKYGYRRYLGDMEFMISPDKSYIEVINFVYIEDYLYGVVPYEMNNSWPIEALKTQAIAARNYVENRMGGKGDYDVVDTSADQVYKGYDPSASNAIKAVDATANTVLTCGGKNVKVYFSASDGGYIEIPQYVWSSKETLQPYHIVQTDPFDLQNPYSPQEALYFPKSITSADKISYQYSKGGKMVTGSGRESANAEKYLKTCALPTVAAKGYIASKIDDIRITGISSITQRQPADEIRDYYGNDACISCKKAEVGMTVLAKKSGSSAAQSVNISFVMDMAALAPGGDYQAFKNKGLRLYVIQESDNGWAIYHRQYGHGVGLSQRGAQQLAKSGYNYQDILNFYFPNTAMTVQDYSRVQLATAPEAEASSATVVSPDSLNVRSSAKVSVSNIIGVLSPGARVYVKKLSGAWYIIEYGGREAYVSAKYIKTDIVAGNAFISAFSDVARLH